MIHTETCSSTGKVSPVNYSMPLGLDEDDIPLIRVSALLEKVKFDDRTKEAHKQSEIFFRQVVDGVRLFITSVGDL